MYEQLVEIGLATYGSIWAGLNAYNFYPEAKRRLDGALDGEDEGEGIELDDDAYEDVSFDLLIPAYDEAEVIEYPLRSFEEAEDYGSEVTPTILLEPDDEETIEAVEELEDEYEFDLEIVPEEYPGEGAKPRALNYGFEQTDGDLVGVIDAEDQVDEDFFEEVYTELIEEGHDYGQGMLDMANEDDGWMNLQFRAEYGNWFQQLMQGYHEAEYPVPLGGTTNVFHREVLEEMSELREDRYDHSWDADDRFWLFEEGLEGDQPWDPDNVTEDFELGMLLWEEDYDMAMLDTVTKEQSPKAFEDWLRQRTRWQKGKIQTLDQYIDDPPEGLREKAHIYLQSALPHMGPVNASGVALSLGATAAGTSLGPEASALMGLGAAGVAGHMAMQADGYRKATDEDGMRKHARTAVAATTLPLYWGMQWLADGRALKQFHESDGSWEKTPHEAIDELYED